MSAIRRLLQRMRAFFRKRELDGELEAELEAHLEMAIDENLERRLSPAEARKWRRLWSDPACRSLRSPPL